MTPTFTCKPEPFPPFLQEEIAPLQPSTERHLSKEADLEGARGQKLPSWQMSCWPSRLIRLGLHER